MNDLPEEHNRYTIEEIAKAIKAKPDKVDEQLNFLWFKKYVFDVHSDNGTKFMISPEGQSVASSMEYLNEGKRLNAELFNNFSSGIFQIIVGITALISLIINIDTIVNLKTELSTVKQEVARTSELLEGLTKDDSIQNNVVDTKEENQTSFQTDDKKKEMKNARQH